jgi:hypothetical protein
MADRNEEMFDAMIRIAGREAMRRDIETFPDEDDIDVHFSPRFERKMKKLIRRGKRKSHKNSKQALRVAMVSIVMIMLTLISAFAFIPQFRETVVKVMIDWTGVSAGFTFPSDGDMISDGIRPAYIPEGFVEADFWENERSVEITYVNATLNEIYYWRVLAEEGTKLTVDSEHSDYTIKRINGLEAHIFTSNTEGYPSYVLLNDDSYAHLFFGDIFVEELTRMAESILKK